MSTLSVADNADGTGGIAAVGGVGPASVVTLYAAPWTGVMTSLSWSAVGGRVGPGTIPVASPATLPVGYYIWTIVEEIAGVPILGPAFYRKLTSGEDATYWRILEAVALRVVELGLENIGSRVYTKSLAVVREQTVSLPAVMITPFGREDKPGSLNATDDIGYPVGVVCVDDQAADSEANLARNLKWRWLIDRAFDQQRVEAASPPVFIARVEPLDVVEVQPFLDGLWASGVVVRAVARERRGLIPA